MKMYQDNSFEAIELDGPLTRVLPVSEEEIHSMMLYEVDAPKAIADLVADRFEKERHDQLLFWLFGAVLVAGTLVAVICFEHKERRRFEQLYIKSIFDEREGR
jgi:hypothetical protein